MIPAQVAHNPLPISVLLRRGTFSLAAVQAARRYVLSVRSVRTTTGEDQGHYLMTKTPCAQANNTQFAISSRSCLIITGTVLAMLLAHPSIVSRILFAAHAEPDSVSSKPRALYRCSQAFVSRARAGNCKVKQVCPSIRYVAQLADHFVLR